MRSKYLLNVNNYIVLDSEIEVLADIFQNWNCLLNDFKFLTKNGAFVEKYFREGPSH